MSDMEFLQAQVDQVLTQGATSTAARTAQVPDPDQRAFTEVSPWLELTRWPEFLQGHNFTAVARLGALPDPVREPLLVVFAASVERLIQAAYESIKMRRINEFDQVGGPPSHHWP